MPNKYIIIAEDDVFIGKLFEMNITQEDWDVHLVTDGAQAIAAMEERMPDFLLLDLLMPKVDGFQVLEHMKEKGYSFPTFILSNLSQEIDEQRARDLGATEFFVKSELDVDELQATMRNAMQP